MGFRAVSPQPTLRFERATAIDDAAARRFWIAYRSNGPEVYGDGHLGESEPFVQRPGRSVEWVTTGTDLDDFDLGGAHLGHGVFAEVVADVLTPVAWRHGQEVDLAVSRFGVDSPGDEAGDGVVGLGGYGRATASLRGMECRNLVSV